MSRKTSVSEKMHKLVSLYHSSGQSQKDFAKVHGLSEGKLHYWIKKFSKKESTAADTTSSFIPIDISNSQTQELLSKTILIRMANGLEIQIPI